MPLAGASEDTANTGVERDPSERSAALRSRRVRIARSSRSAFVTTSTSGISMIPDFRNCSTSPLPGWTTTATVSARSATSVSAWPTPTVSITTTSKAAASASAAARVGRAIPPSRSPAAVERISTPRSEGSNSIRARSPSSDPPERRELGSIASSATVLPRPRQAAIRAERSVDFPAPGGPVTPTTCPGASAPSAAGETSRISAPAWSRSSAALLSSRFSAAGAAARSRSRRRAPSAEPAPLTRRRRPRRRAWRRRRLARGPAPSRCRRRPAARGCPARCGRCRSPSACRRPRRRPAAAARCPARG